MKQENTKTISEILKEFIKEDGLEAGLNRLYVFDAYDKAAGKEMSAFTEKKYYDNGILTCKISSAVARHRLSMSKDSIIGKINKELGREEVKKIIFR